MPNRIEIALKDGVRDARGERIKREIEHFLHLPVDEVRTIDVYTVDVALSPDELSLERARQTPNEILAEAIAIRDRFSIGGWVFGAWVGLVISAKLIRYTLRRRRDDYTADPGACLACARCFDSCPVELKRRGVITELPVIQPEAATP